MRLLRAVRAHAGPALLLLATTVLSVAALVVSAAAAGDDARRASLVPLAALALLVAAGPATDLARRRRAELTLGRLRGAHGAGLLARAAGEPVAVVLVGGAVGLTAGAVTVRLLHRAWDLPQLIQVRELLPAVLLVGALALVAAVAAGVVAREPLQVAIRRATWPGPGASARFVALVAGTATVLAAVLTAYSATTDDPGSLVLAGPVVLGAAAGQVLVWAARGASPTAARAAGPRSTATLLGVRRGLGQAHAARLRAVVAAGVVAASCAGAVVATADWADESARLRQGAPLRLDLDDGTAHGALILTRRLDPDGRWLMAAAVNDGRDEARYRTAWLDLERYDRVAADFLAATAADIGPAVDALRAAPAVRWVTGNVVELSATGPDTATVTLSYVGDQGSVSSVAVPVAGGSAPVDDCAEGCVVLSISSGDPVEVAALALGGSDLLALGWTGAGVVADGGPVALEPGAVVRPAEAAAPEPMLVAGRPDYGDQRPEVDDVGGAPRLVEPVGARPALPLVEGAGLLGDLPVALGGAPGTVPAVRVLVLARADTPDEVIAGLRDAGAGAPVALDPARGGLGGRQRSEDRVRRVGLVAATGLGLLGLAAGWRRRRRDLAQDEAALRLLGVPPAGLRRARLVEAVVLTALVLMATLGGGWLAATVLTDAAGLVPTGPSRLPLDAPVPWVLLLLVALAGAFATGAAALLGPGRTEPARLLMNGEPGL